MKTTIAYATVLATVAVATAAHAQAGATTINSTASDGLTAGQGAYEVMHTSTTETVGGVTTNIQTHYVSTTTVMPDVPVSGVSVPESSPTAVVVPAGSPSTDVKVKLPSGDIISVPDSAEAPWNKDSRLQGYDRFTFDPESGALVAGKGDAKFADKWDDNGNPVKKPAPAPKKTAKVKKVVKKVAAEETTTTTPADAPAADTGMDSPASPAESTPAAVSGTEGQ